MELPDKTPSRLKTGPWLFLLVLAVMLLQPLGGGVFRGRPVGMALFCFAFPFLARMQPLRGMVVNLFAMEERRDKRLFLAFAAPLLAASVAVQFSRAWEGRAGDFPLEMQVALAAALALPWLLVTSWDSTPQPARIWQRLAQLPLMLTMSAGVLGLLWLAALRLPPALPRWPRLANHLPELFPFLVLIGSMLVTVFALPRRAPRPGGGHNRIRPPFAPAAVSVLGGLQVAACFGLAARMLMRPMMGADFWKGLWASTGSWTPWMEVFVYGLAVVFIGALTMAGVLIWLLPPLKRRFYWVGDELMGFRGWLSSLFETAPPFKLDRGAPETQWKGFQEALLVRASRSEGGPLYVIAAHGGGIQATVWTLAVLSRLGHCKDRGLVDLPKEQDSALRAELQDAFWERVVFTTGTSGGAVALAHLYAAWDSQDPEGEFWETLLTKVGGHQGPPKPQAEVGYLDTLAACLLLPWKNRGQALEDRWKSQHRPRREPTLLGMRARVEAGELPMLILGASILETGTPMSMCPLPVPRPMWLMDEDNRDVVSDMHELGKDLHVFTAARLAATFPFVTAMAAPAFGAFKQHFGDLGYFDVNGTFFAFRWLEKVWVGGARVNQGKVGKDRREIKVLVLDGIPQESGARQVDGTLAATFVGPLKLLTRVRAGGQRLRNRELFASLSLDAVRYKAIRLEMSQEQVPLSWQLSDEERQRIHSYLDRKLETILGAEEGQPQG